jgi:hypothetical protein
MYTFHFTTVVSTGYLYKLLALHESLEHYCKNYQLFVLCVEDVLFNILEKLKLNNVILLKLKDIDSYELQTARINRSYLEYCWTLKPIVLYYVMSTFKDAKYYAHLDADLYFYSNPKQIVHESPSSSLFITDHNNSTQFLHTYETSGKFNTGFVCCKNDSIALAAVSWWKDRCIEKCCSTADVKERIFGDQRYVERWPEMLSGVHIVKTKGANVAQWNIDAYKVIERDGEIYVNKDKLIFYHFSGFSILGQNEFNLSTFYKVDKDPLKYIYKPYMKMIDKKISSIKANFPEYNDGFSNKMFVNNVHYVKYEMKNLWSGN